MFHMTGCCHSAALWYITEALAPPLQVSPLLLSSETISLFCLCSPSSDCPGPVGLSSSSSLLVTGCCHSAALWYIARRWHHCCRSVLFFLSPLSALFLWLSLFFFGFRSRLTVFFFVLCGRCLSAELRLKCAAKDCWSSSFLSLVSFPSFEQRLEAFLFLQLVWNSPLLICILHFFISQSDI